MSTPDGNLAELVAERDSLQRQLAEQEKLCELARARNALVGCARRTVLVFCRLTNSYYPDPVSYVDQRYFKIPAAAHLECEVNNHQHRNDDHYRSWRVVEVYLTEEDAIKIYKLIV